MPKWLDSNFESRISLCQFLFLIISLFVEFNDCFYTVMYTYSLIKFATVVLLQECLVNLQDARDNCANNIFFIFLLSI